MAMRALKEDRYMDRIHIDCIVKGLRFESVSELGSGNSWKCEILTV